MDKDNEKPFKTIEVIDSRTNQVCKIACMSCIRGHRTTSCGIPVCRTKIFWTVKRPGRPSNSCTCRYGATGGCKCVVARAACPHKSKKGEKRSGECRCDESGRYCCLLEPEHWTTLLSLQKPTVDFFPTREALEARQAAANQVILPPTPSYSSIASPSSTHSVPNTPGPHMIPQPIQVMPHAYNGYRTPSSSLTPRFGMMGIGAPLGAQHDIGSDVLVWQGQAPPAPREFNPIYDPGPQPERGSCCQASTAPSQSVQTPGPSFHQSQDIQDAPISQPYVDVPSTVSMSQLSPAPFNLEGFRVDYFQHQLPNSICQNCGLSGCTCRNCPPIFQNFGTTSWAQCCGRKHARDVQPTPIPQKMPRTEKYEPSQGLHAQQRPRPEDEALFTEQHILDTNFGQGFQNMPLPPPGVPPDFTTAFDLDHDFNHGLALPDGAEPLDLSEFLLSDLENSQHGLLNGNGNGIVEEQADQGGGDEGEGGAGGGGGCCCGGR